MRARECQVPTVMPGTVAAGEAYPIALYFHRLGGSGGGAQRMISQLANDLSARGAKVHVVSWDEADAQSFYPLDPSVRWSRIGYNSGLRDKARRTLELARVLKDNGIGVLVGFVMSGDKTVYAAARLGGVKRLVAAERNAPQLYDLRYGKAQKAASFALLHLANLITVQLPEFVAGYPRSLRGRIRVIANPVPIAARHARPECPGPGGRLTLLTVSRLDGVQKRISLLVEAFGRIAGRHPEWDLRIIGDGPEEAAVRRCIAYSAIEGRVFLERSSRDVFSAYSEAHLFAIPSRWEGFSNALAEAMAHGLPAVGFGGAAGVAQLITDGETGWLATGLDDPGALADALDRAMSDGVERSRRGKVAIARMAEFTPEAQLGLWQQIVLMRKERGSRDRA